MTSEAACTDCGQRGTFDGWHLAMLEAMGRYQYVYRLKPLGPHRSMADRLLPPLRADCTRCNGRGMILTLAGGRGWRGCPECEGTGGTWTVPEEELQAAYARVLEAFPEAAAPVAPVEFLTGAIVYNLDSQLIIGALHPPARAEVPVQEAAASRAPAPQQEPVAAPPAPTPSASVLPETFGVSAAVVARDSDLFRSSFYYPPLSERRRGLVYGVAIFLVAVFGTVYTAVRPDGFGALGVFCLALAGLIGRVVQMYFKEWYSYRPETERVCDYLAAVTLEATDGIRVPGWDIGGDPESRTRRRRQASLETGERGPGTVARMGQYRDVADAYEEARKGSDWRKRQRLAAWLAWLTLEPVGGDEYLPRPLDPANPTDLAFARTAVAIFAQELQRDHPWAQLPSWPSELFTLPRDIILEAVEIVRRDVGLASPPGGLEDEVKSGQRWVLQAGEMSIDVLQIIAAAGLLVDAGMDEVPTNPEENEAFIQRRRL